MNKTVVRKMYEDFMFDGKPKTWDEYLEMEKQQIIDAWESGEESEYQYHINALYRDNAELYYNQTYGSKGSDDHIGEVNEMIDKTDGNNAEKVPNVASSQAEISDEEILQAGVRYYEPYLRSVIQGFTEGAKWYREQLKKK